MCDRVMGEVQNRQCKKKIEFLFFIKQICSNLNRLFSFSVHAKTFLKVFPAAGSMLAKAQAFTNINSKRIYKNKERFLITI